ncbi:hypothetical protein HN51_054325 [Arachis hypogaea]
MLFITLSIIWVLFSVPSTVSEITRHHEQPQHTMCNECEENPPLPPPPPPEIKCPPPPVPVIECPPPPVPVIESPPPPVPVIERPEVGEDYDDYNDGEKLVPAMQYLTFVALLSLPYYLLV